MEEENKDIKQQIEEETTDTETADEVKTTEKEDSEKKPKKKKTKAKPPIVILSVAALILVVIGLIIFLVKHWEGSGEFYIDTSLDTESETDDRILLMPLSMIRTNDDGITKIVIFGNDTFGDDSDGPSVCKLLQENTTATIYDCTFPGSTMVSSDPRNPSVSDISLDYFSFFWLFDSAKNHDLSEQWERIDRIEGINTAMYREHLKTLESLDFNDIDFVLVCYDGHDYLKGYPPVGEELYSVDCTNGVIYGFNEKHTYLYPELQVIYVAPCFCYARDESGNRVDANLYKINGLTLTDNIMFLRDKTAEYGYCYIDDYFGVNINSETAAQYLTKDDVVPNQEGKKMIAAHIIKRFLRVVESEEKQ